MSSHARDAYEFRPLQDGRSTRVLVLEPAPTRDTPIRCHLVEINLDEFDQRSYSYEALSYIWGERHGTRPIICEGKSLLVTPNCEEALRALRRKITPRVLWIDAICIDQGSDDSDPKEKSHQIRLMGHIYHNASQVLVWLGASNSKLSQILETFPKMAKYASMSKNNNWPLRHYGDWKQQRYRKALVKLLGKKI
jgi:hypothetical protein